MIENHSKPNMLEEARKMCDILNSQNSKDNEKTDNFMDSTSSEEVKDISLNRILQRKKKA